MNNVCSYFKEIYVFGLPKHEANSGPRESPFIKLLLFMFLYMLKVAGLKVVYPTLFGPYVVQSPLRRSLRCDFLKLRLLCLLISRSRPHKCFCTTLTNAFSADVSVGS